jgi:glycosyltransferase involved in cell wall biosynthesis
MSTVVPGRVSVIIPCYNGAKLVHRAVDSVLAQTYPNIEIIVVDDVSNDGLESALLPYEGKITFLRNATNLGTSLSRNAGAAAATGEYLAFLDQDDWWTDDLVTKIVPMVRSGHVVCHDNYFVDASQPFTESLNKSNLRTVFEASLPWKIDQLCKNNMALYFHGAPMLKAIMHRDDFHKVAGYDNRFYGVEDFHFFVKLLSQDVTLQILWEPKGYYLVHEDAITSSISRNPSKNTQSQLRAITGWLHMTKTMPHELSLSQQAIAECQNGEKYWSARYAEVIWKQRKSYIAEKSVWSLAKMIVPNLPVIFFMKLKNARVKLLGRLKHTRGSAH